MLLKRFWAKLLVDLSPVIVALPITGWMSIAGNCAGRTSNEILFKYPNELDFLAQIGQSLLEQEKELFNLWHKFRNDQLTRSELKERVEPIKTKVLSILLEASQLDIDEREKTPLAKTVRTCRNLLKLEVALWLFISSDGVEPTNNAAERAIRPAVPQATD